MENRKAHERRLRAQFVQRAIQKGAPLLATALQRYAVEQGRSWEDLAQELQCSEDALNQIALCMPPRPESFQQDAEAIAEEYADPERLTALLRKICPQK